MERFVRTFKEGMKASKYDSLPLSHRLQNFLFTYRMPLTLQLLCILS